MILLICTEVNTKRYRVNDLIENQFVMNKKFKLNRAENYSTGRYVRVAYNLLDQ